MKKNVYERAREVVQELAPVVASVRARDVDLANQMKRAAQSVVLNIAEARGSYRGNAKTRFGTACGSAKEVRAALHIATDWAYIESAQARRIDDALDTVCAITWTLANR